MTGLKNIAPGNPNPPMKPFALISLKNVDYIYIYI